MTTRVDIVVGNTVIASRTYASVEQAEAAKERANAHGMQARIVRSGLRIASHIRPMSDDERDERNAARPSRSRYGSIRW